MTERPPPAITTSAQRKASHDQGVRQAREKYASVRKLLLPARRTVNAGRDFP